MEIKQTDVLLILVCQGMVCCWGEECRDSRCWAFVGIRMCRTRIFNTPAFTDREFQTSNSQTLNTGNPGEDALFHGPCATPRCAGAGAVTQGPWPWEQLHRFGDKWRRLGVFPALLSLSLQIQPLPHLREGLLRKLDGKPKDSKNKCRSEVTKL